MQKSNTAHQATWQIESETVELIKVRIVGPLDASTVADTWKQVDGLLHRQKGKPKFVLDAAGMSRCDVSGVALIKDLQSRLEERGSSFSMEGLRDDVAPLMNLFEAGDLKGLGPKKPGPSSLPAEVGSASLGIFQDIYSQIVFVGELTRALVFAFFHPRQVRWKDALLTAERAGVNALPIAILIGFLVGLIIALQAAIPMRQFGTEIFVANLVALAMLRELGPLMTAIVLAGRSGSAFAAEIGTMKVNDEISALTTMGLDPMRFLVVPRVIAAVIVMPILVIFANVAGLLGGLVVMMFWLGFPFVTFYNQVVGQIVILDPIGGLIKAFVFGILVAGIGCLRGLQTKSGASAVGDSTTSAVVTGIVLIVVANGIFTYLYSVLGI